MTGNYSGPPGGGGGGGAVPESWLVATMVNPPPRGGVFDFDLTRGGIVGTDLAQDPLDASKINVATTGLYHLSCELAINPPGGGWPAGFDRGAVTFNLGWSTLPAEHYLHWSTNLQDVAWLGVDQSMVVAHSSYPPFWIPAGESVSMQFSMSGDEIYPALAPGSSVLHIVRLA